ncbi:MAG: PEGA domain-containing protein [Planctomycetota bacterium]
MRTYFKAMMLFCLAVLVVCTGCVSNHHRLLSQDGDLLYIETTPTGANVLINNEFKGITPLTIKLPEDKPVLSLKVTKDGYETEEVTLAPREEKVDSRKQNILINSTVFFGAVGLVAGLASGMALQGLGGGTLLGLTVGLLQEDKNLTTRYEYPQEDIQIKLSPIKDK